MTVPPRLGICLPRSGGHNAMALIYKCGMGSPLALLGAWQASRAVISCFHQLTELSVAERDNDQLSTDRPHLQSDGSKYRISLSRRSRAEGLQSMAAARNDLVS
jgi:hypothetical protein